MKLKENTNDLDTPMPYEPRDRGTQPEDSMDEVPTNEPVNTKPPQQDLADIVKECMMELKEEKISNIKEALRPIVKKFLKENAASIKVDKKEDEIETEDKQHSKKGNEHVNKSNSKLVDELEKIAKGIDEKANVYIDDNDDIVVADRQELKIRVCPRWENNFDIDAYIKMTDRVRVIGHTWEQVKEFIKSNFGKNKDTYVDTAYNKSKDAIKDKVEKAVKELPQHNITTIKKVSDTKKDNKDYNEKQVSKKEDEPNQPMKEVGDKVKKQVEYTEKDNKVKPPKHKNDDKLTVKNDKKTSKFKVKK